MTAYDWLDRFRQRVLGLKNLSAPPSMRRRKAGKRAALRRGKMRFAPAAPQALEPRSLMTSDPALNGPWPLDGSGALDGLGRQRAAGQTSALSITRLRPAPRPTPRPPRRRTPIEPRFPPPARRPRTMSLRLVFRRLRPRMRFTACSTTAACGPPSWRASSAQCTSADRPVDGPVDRRVVWHQAGPCRQWATWGMIERARRCLPARGEADFRSTIPVGNSPRASLQAGRRRRVPWRRPMPSSPAPPRPAAIPRRAAPVRPRANRARRWARRAARTSVRAYTRAATARGVCPLL